MILHENRLPADDSHEISCLICYFGKSGKICNCHLLQIIGGALWVKSVCSLVVRLGHKISARYQPDKYRTHNVQVSFMLHNSFILIF